MTNQYKLSLYLLAILSFRIQDHAAETLAHTEIESAVQLKVESKESYRYQIQHSTNLVNWSNLGDPITACSNIIVRSTPIQFPIGAFRVQELPPDLSHRIPGLRLVGFDTAITSLTGSSIKVEGMRCESDLYTQRDYLVANYSLDLCQQALLLTNLEVYPNIGSTTRDPFFFLEPAESEAIVEVNGRVYKQGEQFTLSSAQVVKATLLRRQQVAFEMFPPPRDLRLLVKDSNGKTNQNATVGTCCYYFVEKPMTAFTNEIHTLEIAAADGKPIAVTCVFRNVNSAPVPTIKSGSTISATAGPFASDHTMWRIAIPRGKVVRCAGPGTATILAVDSSGIGVGSLGGGNSSPFPVFRAPKDDTYTLIYYRRTLGDSSYSSLVTVGDN